MITQKLILPILLVLIADASALFYFLKDHNKHQHSHEEVDHHNYHNHDEHKHHEHKHHGDHKHHEYKHHDDHKHYEHKPQEHKHHDDHKYHQHKYHDDHKPQEHKHHDDHKYHQHKHHDDHKHQNHKYQGYKHQEDHKHHEHKPQPMHHEQKPQQMHKHHEYDHHYHHHHQGYHQDEHRHEHNHHGHQDHHGHHGHHEHYQEQKYQGQPHYEFKYGVRDPNTGDIKNQWEMRKGDEVQGEYSLLEADGTIRTVQYTAGKHTGFNAVVKKQGKARHPLGTEPHAKVTFPVVQHPKGNFHSVKPVHQEPETFDSKAKGSRVYTDVDTSRLHYYNPSNLPTNHKPVFSGIDEESNLLALYKQYPIHNLYRNEERGFDYGINEYLTKRSYDLSKITEVLNASPTIDPIRAARGSFVMGR